MVDIKPGDRLFAADDLVVAVAPTQSEQVVEHGFRQDAQLIAIRVHAQRAVALRQLGPVRSVDQRDVAIGRTRPAHRVEDRQLAKGIVEVVVTPDHVGHTHVVIVDDDGQHVGRRAVGAQQHEIVQLRIRDRDHALDKILDHRLALTRGLDPDDIGLAFGPARRIGIAPFTDDAERATLRLGSLAAGGQFFRGQVAAIGVASREQLVSDFGMTVRARELEHGRFVTAQAQPLQPVENRLDRRLGRAGAIGILDPQQVLAAMVAGEQPVEQRGAGTADMQVAGGRGGKPRHDAATVRRCSASYACACH